MTNSDQRYEYTAEQRARDDAYLDMFNTPGWALFERDLADFARGKAEFMIGAPRPHEQYITLVAERNTLLMILALKDARRASVAAARNDSAALDS